MLTVRSAGETLQERVLHCDGICEWNVSRRDPEPVGLYRALSEQSLQTVHVTLRDRDRDAGRTGTRVLL